MKAYLIPGWGEDLKDRDYRAVLNIYKAAGYEPEFVKIDWKYKTIEDWVEQVKSKISKQDLQSSLLSGFSFGAVTALSLAGYYQQPAKLLLFSLSCFYAEDQKTVPNSWLRAIGKHRAETFNQISFDDLANRINCPTMLFLGSKEDSEMKIRARDAHKKIKKSKLIMVEGAKHDTGDPKYVEAIRKALK